MNDIENSCDLIFGSDVSEAEDGIQRISVILEEYGLSSEKSKIYSRAIFAVDEELQKLPQTTQFMIIKCFTIMAIDYSGKPGNLISIFQNHVNSEVVKY